MKRGAEWIEPLLEQLKSNVFENDAVSVWGKPIEGAGTRALIDAIRKNGSIKSVCLNCTSSPAAELTALFELAIHSDNRKAVRCIRLMSQELTRFEHLPDVFSSSTWLHTLQISRCKMKPETAVQLAHAYAGSTRLKTQLKELRLHDKFPDCVKKKVSFEISCFSFPIVFFPSRLQLPGRKR